MPLLDLGERPSTHNPEKSESSQEFLIPKSDYKERVIVKYDEYRPRFKTKSLFKKYEKASFKDRGIEYAVFDRTLYEAGHYLAPYRGKVSKLDLISTFFLSVGFIIAIGSSMAAGILDTWLLSLAIVVGFFVLAGIVHYSLKHRSNKLIRQAHFVLGVYCRSENNRFYLSKGIELRPGYLGKWISFVIHTPPPTSTSDGKWLLRKLQERFGLSVT